MAQNVTILQDVANAGLSSWDAAPFLEKVTDIVPSILYVFNQKSQSNEYSNRSLGASLGYSVQELQQMGAKMMPQLCHPEDLAKVSAHFQGIMALADGEVITLEYRMRHKEGFWVWLLSTDTVFDRDDYGRVERHIGVASDITAQKTAEELANAERLKAVTTNDELRAFSYSMSHDMKAPSNTLNLLLSELMDSHGASLDDDAIELVNMAQSTVKRMSGLVDDVLNYTRVVNQDFSTEPVPLNLILNTVIDSLQEPIKREGAVIEVGDLPVVSADPMQIGILLKNLIENGIKFHSPGVAPKLSITSSIQPNVAGYAITVKDDGIGIPLHKQDDIFTIFKRLNGETEYKGTGLGLAICRRIAANHGSTITLVSNPGEGAAFTIGLPKA